MAQHGSFHARRRRAVVLAGALLLGAAVPVPLAAAEQTTAPTAQAIDTVESAPLAVLDEPSVPGAVPVAPPAASEARMATAAAVGSTSSYMDQAGTKVFRVDQGYDLDRYLFADSSPLDASIDVDAPAGPVDAGGHPAPGHVLYGKTGRLTLRVFDVDEDYTGGTFAREIDEVRVNGQAVNAFLAGADNQWSVVSFAVPLSALRVPIVAGESARNDIQVMIDTGNGGQLVWAVQVDWMELRLSDQPLPAALMHGITMTGTSMGAMQEVFEELPQLDDRVIAPDVTRNGSIAANAQAMRGPLQSLLDRTSSSQLNIAAHSMGGLNSRLYIWDNPGQVRGLVMVGTPNGGSHLADILCGNRSIPWYLRGGGSYAIRAIHLSAPAVGSLGAYHGRGADLPR